MLLFCVTRAEAFADYVENTVVRKEIIRSGAKRKFYLEIRTHQLVKVRQFSNGIPNTDCSLCHVLLNKQKDHLK